MRGRRFATQRFVVQARAFIVGTAEPTRQVRLLRARPRRVRTVPRPAVVWADVKSHASTGLSWAVRVALISAVIMLGLFGNDSRTLFAATLPGVGGAYGTNGGSGCPTGSSGGGNGIGGGGSIGIPGASLNVFSSAFAQSVPCPPTTVVTATQRLANDHQGLLVTNNVLGGILLGRNEQINCTDCITAFGSAGSFSFGAHGRKQLTQDLSIVGGVAFAEYRSGGLNVTGTPLLAGLFRYDMTERGASRPFAEVGVIAAPGQHVISTRIYYGGSGQAGSTATTGTVFGRLGWVNRFTPQDEAAAAVEVWHGWQRFGGYSESALPSNPFPLVTAGGVDQMSTVVVGGQWTHLWNAKIETQVNLGVARTFGSHSGLNAVVTGINVPTPLGDYTFGTYGLRVGYRIRQNVIIDAFADGTLGDRPINTTVHGGLALRYAF